MPWPQYFDGKYWKTDLAVKYSINAIPAMFLLDQDGKVVSTHARGPKLEEEVKLELGTAGRRNNEPRHCLAVQLPRSYRSPKTAACFTVFHRAGRPLFWFGLSTMAGRMLEFG